MADGAPLRPGPDSTTDLVLHEGGGSRARVVPLVLIGAAKSLLVPVALGAITVAVAVVQLGTGTDAATVGQVVLRIAAVEAALAAPLLVWMELSTVRRLRFAPAQAPGRFRLVRAARPGRWKPITQLCGVRLEHRITEPYPGDRQPAAEQLTVRFDLAGDELKWTPPARTSPGGCMRPSPRCSAPPGCGSSSSPSAPSGPARRAGRAGTAGARPPPTPAASRAGADLRAAGRPGVAAGSSRTAPPAGVGALGRLGGERSEKGALAGGRGGSSGHGCRG